jgi:hypothetical protein
MDKPQLTDKTQDNNTTESQQTDKAQIQNK